MPLKTSQGRINKGFTLIELMITLAIVAILTSIAYPSYTSHVRKSVRASAQTQMMEIASRQQQFLLANRVYADKTALESSGYALPSDLSGKYTYDISVGTNAVPSYTITFTATGVQASDGALSLTSEGVKTPAAKW